LTRRCRLLVGIAAAVAFSALFAPATSAGKQVHSAAHVRLALVPLRKAQLGKAGSSLSLAHDSGPVPRYGVGTDNPLLWTSSTDTFFSLNSNFLRQRG
jgi:hypothetical protein